MTLLASAILLAMLVAGAGWLVVFFALAWGEIVAAISDFFSKD